MRKIIHIDMDAFYASVEQRDNPELRGRPVAVGGSPNGRGVLTTASYEARKFGLHSAMPSARARQLCPHVIFVRPRMEVYKTVSKEIREIFREYTDLVEPLSLDEAYLDVTENHKGIWSAIKIAWHIKNEIRDRTQLTATAGVSFNKFLAKMASGYKKPDGLNYIPQETAQQFIDELPVGKFHGIGKKTAERMKTLGIHTGLDLRNCEPHYLRRHFGKVGRFYHRIANGEDERGVVSHRPMKSTSNETTFSEDTGDLEEIDTVIKRLAASLMNRLHKYKTYGRTVHLKVKFANFRIATRSQSFPDAVTELDQLIETACDLLRRTEAGERKIRLIGVGVSNFGTSAPRRKGGQLGLFDEEE